MNSIVNKNNKHISRYISSEWAIKDLQMMQKHIKNAKNFEMSTSDFILKRDKEWNKKLNHHLGMASVLAEMLEKRIKKGEIKK